MEAVKHSPLMSARNKGQYSPIAHQTTDPFIQGIVFPAIFIGTIEVEDRVGTDKTHNTVNKKLDEVQKTKKDKDLKKVAIIVKAVSLSVRDIQSKSKSKSEVTYPIYVVSYCGNARDADTIFFFIHKSKVDQKIRAEIFKCSTQDKVVAITRTVSKAFSIAYKAWQMKKRQQQRGNSPLLERHSAKDRDTIDLGRKAVEKAAGSTGGFYTPPIPRKTPEKTNVRPRSGSLEDEDRQVEQMAASLVRKNPALERIKVKNETSGTHR